MKDKHKYWSDLLSYNVYTVEQTKNIEKPNEWT